jgi:hypothetical protein
MIPRPIALRRSLYKFSPVNIKKEIARTGRNKSPFDDPIISITPGP